MAIILRRDKGSTLTHDELDDNFQELLNRVNLDSDIIKRFTLDSADTINLIDSSYIEFRRPPEVVFDVSNNGTAAWRFNEDGFSTGVDNPTLYLQRGLTYKFEIDALGHPFEFRLSNGGVTYTTGVTGSGTQLGNIFFTPDMDAPNTLVYQCANHSSMVGDIVILDNNTFLDSDSVTNLIDSAYIQQRVPESYLETIIDSNYVQSRVTLRDSSFVSGIVDSSYLSVIIDSDYVSSRQSGSGAGIVFSTASGSVTKVGDGNVFVEIAGGGGWGTQSGATRSHGGDSFARGMLLNVPDGATITYTIGAGTNSQTGQGGSSSVNDGLGNSITIMGGISANAALGIGAYTNYHVTGCVPLVTGTAIGVGPGGGGAGDVGQGGSLFRLGGFTAKGVTSQYSNTQNIGYGRGGPHAIDTSPYFSTAGTSGAILLIGV